MQDFPDSSIIIRSGPDEIPPDRRSGGKSSLEPFGGKTNIGGVRGRKRKTLRRTRTTCLSPLCSPTYYMELALHGASAAGEVALAQVAGARIVGQSGTSNSSVAVKQNVARIFSQFRDEKSPALGTLMGATRGATHELISEDDATNRKVWEMFATYIFDGYKKPAGSRGQGEGVAIQTAQDYLKCALNLARDVYKEAAFFKCLDKDEDVRRNDDRKWFMDLRD